MNHFGTKVMVRPAPSVFFKLISGGMVNDDFRSKHALRVLHVWLLRSRLIKIETTGIVLDEALFDEFWEDTSNRIRSLGVSEMMVIW